MPEIDLNTQLTELLINHKVKVWRDNEFIYTDLPSKAKFKARSVYAEVSDYISSQ